MQETCLLCHAALEPEPDDFSHPILKRLCPECSEAVVASKSPVSLSEYLNRFNVPVLVMEDDVRVAGFNEAARALLGCERQNPMGKLGGDALECEYARLPDGCGKTEHCKTCAIRRAVTATYLSGDSKVRVPAYQHLLTPEGRRKVRFLISTEKAGRFVLLRIDAITACS